MTLIKGVKVERYKQYYMHQSNHLYLEFSNLFIVVKSKYIKLNLSKIVGVCKILNNDKLILLGQSL